MGLIMKSMLEWMTNIGKNEMQQYKEQNRTHRQMDRTDIVVNVVQRMGRMPVTDNAVLIVAQIRVEAGVMEKFNFFTIFLLVFLAEIPCIVRTMALQVQNKGIWEVVLGTLAGSGLALVVGILLAKFATRFIENPLWIQYMSGLAIIVLGIIIFFRSH